SIPSFGPVARSLLGARSSRDHHRLRGPRRRPGGVVNEDIQQRLDVDTPIVAAAVELDALSVLVVDDDLADQRLLLEALVDAGANRERVTCVGTMREARHALIEHPVSCILL